MDTGPDWGYFERVGGRVREAAETAGDTVFGLLRDGISGRSDDGNVTVWVNALGQVQRVHIAPDTVREGDESRLADAFAQAARAATTAATELVVPPELRGDDRPPHSDGDEPPPDHLFSR